MASKRIIIGSDRGKGTRLSSAVYMKYRYSKSMNDIQTLESREYRII